MPQEYHRQTRKESLIETVINTAFGFLVSALAWPIVAALAGYPYSLSHNMAITGFFTVLSVARGYVVRRFFETRFRSMARWIAERRVNDNDRQRGAEERSGVLRSDGVLPVSNGRGSPVIQSRERQAQPGSASALVEGEERRPCGLYRSASVRAWQAGR